jgi:hypothetical protein
MHIHCRPNRLNPEREKRLAYLMPPAEGPASRPGPLDPRVKTIAEKLKDKDTTTLESEVAALKSKAQPTAAEIKATMDRLGPLLDPEGQALLRQFTVPVKQLKFLFDLAAKKGWIAIEHRETPGLRIMDNLRGFDITRGVQLADGRTVPLQSVVEAILRSKDSREVEYGWGMLWKFVRERMKPILGSLSKSCPAPSVLEKREEFTQLLNALQAIADKAYTTAGRQDVITNRHLVEDLIHTVKNAHTATQIHYAFQGIDVAADKNYWVEVGEELSATSVNPETEKIERVKAQRRGLRGEYRSHVPWPSVSEQFETPNAPTRRAPPLTPSVPSVPPERPQTSRPVPPVRPTPATPPVRPLPSVPPAMPPRPAAVPPAAPRSVPDPSAFDADKDRLDAIVLDPAFSGNIAALTTFEGGRRDPEAARRLRILEGLLGTARRVELASQSASEDPIDSKIADAFRSAQSEWSTLNALIEVYKANGQDVRGLEVRRLRAANIANAWAKFRLWSTWSVGIGANSGLRNYMQLDNMKQEGAVLDEIFNAPHLLTVFTDRALGLLNHRKSPLGFHADWKALHRNGNVVPPMPFRNGETPFPGSLVRDRLDTTISPEDYAQYQAYNSGAFRAHNYTWQRYPIPQDDFVRKVIVKSAGNEYHFDFSQGGETTLYGPEGIGVQILPNSPTVDVYFSKPGNFEYRVVFARNGTSSGALTMHGPLKEWDGKSTAPTPAVDVTQKPAAPAKTAEMQNPLRKTLIDAMESLGPLIHKKFGAVENPNDAFFDFVVPGYKALYTITANAKGNVEVRSKKWKDADANDFVREVTPKEVAKTILTDIERRSAAAPAPAPKTTPATAIPEVAPTTPDYLRNSGFKLTNTPDVIETENGIGTMANAIGENMKLCNLEVWPSVKLCLVLSNEKKVTRAFLSDDGRELALPEKLQQTAQYLKNLRVNKTLDASIANTIRDEFSTILRTELGTLPRFAGELFEYSMIVRTKQQNLYHNINPYSGMNLDGNEETRLCEKLGVSPDSGVTTFYQLNDDKQIVEIYFSSGGRKLEISKTLPKTYELIQSLRGKEASRIENFQKKELREAIAEDLKR